MSNFFPPFSPFIHMGILVSFLGNRQRTIFFSYHDCHRSICITAARITSRLWAIDCRHFLFSTVDFRYSCDIGQTKNYIYHRLYHSCCAYFSVADFVYPANILYVLYHFATIISIILFCIVLLSHVFKKGPITFHRIQGAMIEHFMPGSFSGALTDSSGFSSLIFFSFVTLATLGYGDIAPVHPLARSLAVAEAITGQLYLAILIARLVSQELYYRKSRERDKLKDHIEEM